MIFPVIVASCADAAAGSASSAPTRAKTRKSRLARVMKPPVPLKKLANNSPMPLTRRSFLAATSASLTTFPRSLRGQDRNVELAFRQYHNQTAASSLHMRLVQMWDAVYKESGGRLVCKVFPQNNNIQGSDPAALKALVAGDIQFFTLMGGILGTLMPVAEVQQV